MMVAAQNCGFASSSSSSSSWLWLTLLAAVSCCVVVVVADVELMEGTGPLNSGDPVQYKDCGHLHKAGYREDGVHVLYMNKTTPFLIRCEFTNDTAINMIQRRMNGLTNFDLPLTVYIDGFGSAHGDYWAGLDRINFLTIQQRNTVLTIQMADWAGNIRNARYSSFRVLSQDTRYQMFASGFSGTVPGDDFGYSSGMTFQTYDIPDSNNCATFMRAGWWYNYCAYALLNGHYYVGGPYTPSGSFYDGIFWKSWGGLNYSLKFVSMAVSTK